MSKTISTTVLSAPIVDFLYHIGLRNRWIDALNSGDPKCRLSADGVIIFYVRSAEELGTIYIVTIKLALHTSLPIYLLEKFNVSSNIGNKAIMEGDVVLNHYNKRFANQDARSEMDVSAYWTINCAQNLEALLNAYDKLAELHYCHKIFNLPR